MNETMNETVNETVNETPNEALILKAIAPHCKVLIVKGATLRYKGSEMGMPEELKAQVRQDQPTILRFLLSVEGIQATLNSGISLVLAPEEGVTGILFIKDEGTEVPQRYKPYVTMTLTDVEWAKNMDMQLLPVAEMRTRLFGGDHSTVEGEVTANPATSETKEGEEGHALQGP